MICGYSYNDGIMIYDSSNKQGVYAYYNQDEVCFIEGSVSEIESQINTTTDEKNLNKLVIISFIFVVISVLYSLFNLPIMFTLSLVLFYYTSYMKFNIVIYSLINTNKQFKRFHASEHKLLNTLNNVTIENLRKASPFHRSCGTIEACNIVVFMLVFCLSLAFIFEIGILAFIRNILIISVILFINLFNRYNPFFLIQRHVINTPTDYELNLALKLYEKYKEVVE